MKSFSIACDCGNEVCGTNPKGVISDDAKKWLEDIGWQYIGGKPSCPKCNGTEGQWNAVRQDLFYAKELKLRGYREADALIRAAQARLRAVTLQLVNTNVIAMQLSKMPEVEAC